MVKRSITDDELLELLACGVLEVDIQTAEVKCRGKALKPSETGLGLKTNTRMRISIRAFGKQRRIVRSRLVYMAATLRLIPDGYELHHVDEDRYNDSFHNLILLTAEDHLKLHQLFKYENRPSAVLLTDAPF